MSLIGKLIDKLLTNGSLTLLRPGKPPETFGPRGGKHLTIRFTDLKVGFDIARNPRLGVGEAFMDGRLMIEDGTILDLLELIVGGNRWEDQGEGRKAIEAPVTFLDNTVDVTTGTVTLKGQFANTEGRLQCGGEVCFKLLARGERGHAGDVPARVREIRQRWCQPTRVTMGLAQRALE